MKQLLILILSLISTTMIAQTGLVEVIAKTNCSVTDKYIIDIFLQSESAVENINIAEQNFRFSFNPNALFVDPVDLSSPIVLTAGSDLNFESLVSSGINNLALFNEPTLTGSNSSVISLNIVMPFGDGYNLSSTSPTYICSIEFDIIDPEEPIDFNWHDENIFPPSLFLAQTTNGKIPVLGEYSQAIYNCINPFIVTLPNSYTNCASFGGVVTLPEILLADLIVLNDPSGNITFNLSDPDIATANNLVPGIYEFDINGSIHTFEILDACGICICPDDVSIACSSDNLDIAVPLAIWAQPLKECIALGNSYTVFTTISNNTITTELSIPDESCVSMFTVNGMTDCNVFDQISNYNTWLNNHFPDPEDCLVDMALLHDDLDKFIDGVSYTSNPVSIFPDVSTPGTIFKDVSINLYFRTQGLSCSNDIIIRVTDPAGNQFEFSNLFAQNTCEPSILLNTQIEIPFAYTLGNNSQWIIEYRNMSDSNTGDEFSVRYAGISYEMYQTNVSECPDELIVAPDCLALAPESLTIDQESVSGEFTARTLVTATTTTLETTEFISGNSIVLKGGFEVSPNSNFKAEIKSCVNDDL